MGTGQKMFSKTHQAILAYMTNHGGVTQSEAFLNLGVGRLGARIYEMRERGIPIRSEMVKVKKMDGTDAFVARYSIETEAAHGGAQNVH